MGETRAGDYYRRSGLNTVPVRGRPGVRTGENTHQIHHDDLAIDQHVELIVHPELTVRSKPWKFYGKVVRFYNGTVVLRQLAGEQTGTIIRIPYRYFEDGRVFQKEIF